MIRLTVLYPNQPGARFDETYYLEKHIPFVKQLLGGFGLIRTEMDKGLTVGKRGDPAPFVWAGHMYFNSIEDLRKAFATHGVEMAADVPNYTNIQPQTQISEIVVYSPQVAERD